MPIQTAVFIATSLDGYIARPDGALDWLEDPGSDGEDYGYARFMADIDGLVMGRKTFETALGFADWPYAGRPVTVLSRTLGTADIPPALAASVRRHAGPPAELLAAEAAAGRQRLYIDGGQTVCAFLNAGLIDEMTLTRIPVLLGRGIPLFGELSGPDIRWQHLRTRSFTSGLVQSTYRRLPAAR